MQLAAQTRKLEQAEKKVRSSNEQAKGLKEQIQAQTAARQKAQDSFNKQLQVLPCKGVVMWSNELAFAGWGPQRTLQTADMVDGMHGSGAWHAFGDIAALPYSSAQPTAI